MNKELIKKIIELKKRTGAKIKDCRLAIEKFKDFAQAVNFVLDNAKVNVSENQNNHFFCKIDKLNDLFVYLSFSTETDFVLKMIKNENIDTYLDYSIINKDKPYDTFAQLKKKLEKHFFLLTKEKVVLRDFKIFDSNNFIFYNNLNGDSCSYVSFEDKSNSLEEKNINYKILHSNFSFKLSKTENIIKNLCVSINCLESKEVERVNSYLLDNTIDISNILDVFSEKPILNTILFLNKKNIQIVRVNRLFSNE